MQVGSLQCSGLQERLAAHRDHGGGLGLQGGGGEQCGGVVTAAQPTLPDTGYRWEQRPGPYIQTLEWSRCGECGAQYSSDLVTGVEMELAEMMDMTSTQDAGDYIDDLLVSSTV